MINPLLLPPGAAHPSSAGVSLVTSARGLLLCQRLARLRQESRERRAQARWAQVCETIWGQR